MKRAMAAEFSRKLSVKCLEDHKRSARLGYRQGSIPGYGFRRLLVDDKGSPKAFLKNGERKHLQTDKVVLVPGPHEGIETIRDIFRLFVGERTSRKEIAKILNKGGLRNACGNRWTDNNVLHVLSNEKYIENLVYNKTLLKLQTAHVAKPRCDWIRAENASEPVIDPKLFFTPIKNCLLFFPRICVLIATLPAE